MRERCNLLTTLAFQRCSSCYSTWVIVVPANTWFSTVAHVTPEHVGCLSRRRTMTDGQADVDVDIPMTCSLLMLECEEHITGLERYTVWSTFVFQRCSLCDSI
jgi:hypothetical protein